MRLNKIRQVCKAAGQVYVITADGMVGNMVTQWIGTARALYPVVGLNLDLRTLMLLWEMDPVKSGLDAHEGTMADMVERGLLEDEDAQLLRHVPAKIDADNAPLIGLGEINGYKALACGDEAMCFLQGWLLDPCFKQGNIRLEIMAGAGRRVAVYAGDSIVGVLWPAEESTSRALGGILSAMARREPV